MGVMRVDKAFHRRAEEWERAFRAQGMDVSQAKISRFFVHTYIPKPEQSEIKLLRWFRKI